MSGTDVLRRLAEKVGAVLASRRHARAFTCADCEISDRCGRPPSEKCVERASQMESGRTRRRGDYLAEYPY